MNRMKKLSSGVSFTDLLNNLEQSTPLPPENPDDPLPENSSYRDEGCELSPACLECHLPQCILDCRLSSMNKSARDAEIQRLYTQSGLTAADLARLFGVSERTVWRAIRKSGT